MRSMRLQPIVYVTDMAAATSWYSDLLEAEPETASDHWTSFAIAGGHLALHLTDTVRPVGNVELSLVSSEPLETLVERIASVREIAVEPFGRSVVVSDPDGTLIQINEHN